jgi:integrase
MPKAKTWSKTIEERGVRIRIYERPNSAALYREYRHPDGRKLRKSLKTTDRAVAEERARELARQLALADLTGAPIGEATFGAVRRAYLLHRGPELSANRLRFMKTTLALFAAFLEPGGRSFRMDDFGQHHADAYLNARRSGKLAPDALRAKDAPRDGTLRNELQALSTVCNWAVGFKRDGRRLLTHNPIRDVKMPQEKNRMRPLMTEARYRKLLAVSDEADPEGRLRVLLVLAWETGRRINAILHLKASDVLMTEEQVRRTLQEEGQDEALADHWPHALRWRPEWDKVGYLDFSPLSEAARGALQDYLQRHPAVGETWIFPGNREPSKVLDKLMAAYYLTKAEKLAGLSKQKGGGWHPFRRAWATRRKHLPVQDVMAAGGWRDVKALQSAYQGADPKTTRRVVELG